MSAWCSFKIQRISAAEERDLLATDVPKALKELQAMGSWDGLHVSSSTLRPSSPTNLSRCIPSVGM